MYDFKYAAKGFVASETACLILASIWLGKLLRLDGANTDNFTQKLSVNWMELGNKTGSRNRDGNVPNANWNSDSRRVYVNWYNPGNANSNLRSRSEVSAKRVEKTLFVLTIL